jgi:hypothetical protein
MALNPNAPSWAVPIVDPQSGQLTQPWHGYLAQLAGAPGPILADLAVGPSPFAYTAPSGGTLSVHGGTVSLITISRARVSGVNVGFTSGSVSVAANDVVTITYSVAPTVNFIPL